MKRFIHNPWMFLFAVLVIQPLNGYLFAKGFYIIAIISMLLQTPNFLCLAFVDINWDNKVENNA